MKCRGHSLQTDGIQRAGSFKRRQHWGHSGLNCVCAKAPALFQKRKEIPEVHSQGFLGGGRGILGDIKRKVVESDRQPEMRFTKPTGGICASGQGAVDCKVRERRGRKWESGGHMEAEHWPGALVRAVPLQETQRGGGKEKRIEKEQKPTFHAAPRGAHAVAPYMAAPIWLRHWRTDAYWITSSTARCPVMPAPSHTHNKHTPSPVRPKHAAQREHINYRCTLNYFHYLPYSVVRTKTRMMDGRGCYVSLCSESPFFFYFV